MPVSSVGVETMSKPTSSIADLMSAGESSFEWVTVTVCVTIDTSTDVGGGTSEDKASSIVLTQLQWNLVVVKKGLWIDSGNRSDVPATVQIRDKYCRDDTSGVLYMVHLVHLIYLDILHLLKGCAATFQWLIEETVKALEVIGYVERASR